jgi:hypothetical protein
MHFKNRLPDGETPMTMNMVRKQPPRYGLMLALGGVLLVIGYSIFTMIAG